MEAVRILFLRALGFQLWNKHMPIMARPKQRKEALEDDTSMGVLPRAVLRPSSFILPDGELNFSNYSMDMGIQEGWFLDHAYEYKANWPSVSWHDKGVVWYEREFPTPSMEGLPRSLVQPTFGACGYETRI